MDDKIKEKTKVEGDKLWNDFVDNHKLLLSSCDRNREVLKKRLKLVEKTRRDADSEYKRLRQLRIKAYKEKGWEL